MVTIKKVWMTGCEPCKKLSEILAQVEGDYILEDYNIAPETARTERLAGKAILTKYAVTKVPFLLFVNEAGESYAAIYAESGEPTVEDIEFKIEQGS